MDYSFLLKGVIIGFSIAAPIGPIGVLCIRRSLGRGRVFGLVSGLGASTADAIYGCIAGFGLTLVSNFLVSQQIFLRLISGSFLCFLGFSTFLSEPAEEVVQVKRRGLLDSYASTFFLTITNPMTVLSFAAIFAGLGVGGVPGNYASASALVSGVFVGSALWWLVLSYVASLFRTKLTPERLRWVNRFSGMIIMGFGVVALLSLIG